MPKNSLCHRIKKNIKRFDFFSTTITFTMNNEYRFHSFIGGLLFIIFIIIALLYSFYCAWGFFKRKNIDFIFARKIVESGPSINLRETDFNLGFGIQKFNSGEDYVFPNIDYFSYKMEFVDWNGNEEKNKKRSEIPLKLCEKSDFKNRVDSIFDNKGINKLYCPVIDDNLNYTLSGLYTDYNFRYLIIKIHLSDYGMSHLEETKKFLNENALQMSIYFIDTSYNYKSRTNVVSKKLNYLFRPIDYHFIKYTTIYISLLEFLNDENLIIRKSSKSSNSLYDYSIDTFKYKETRVLNDNLIAQFNIQASSTIYQLQRNYQKLPAFIAELAGFIGILLICLLSCIRVIEKQIIDNKLVNHMLTFKGSKFNDIEYFINCFNNDKKNNKISSILDNRDSPAQIKNNLNMHTRIPKELNLFDKDNENIKNIRNESLNLNFNTKINNFTDVIERRIVSSNVVTYQKKNSGKRIVISKEIKDNINQENIPNTIDVFKNEEETHDKINNEHLDSSITFKKEKKKKNNKEIIFPLSYSQYFFSYILFCCSNTHKKRYNAIKSAEFRIHYYMDIFNFIKKMQEIDLLKYCLFDKDQITLFDFTSKTPFKIDDNGQEVLYRTREKIMINKKNFQKNDLDDIFNSYRIIRIKDELSFEDLKLLELVRSEVAFLGGSNY